VGLSRIDTNPASPAPIGRLTECRGEYHLHHITLFGGVNKLSVREIEGVEQPLFVASVVYLAQVMSTDRGTVAVFSIFPFHIRLLMLPAIHRIKRLSKLVGQRPNVLN